MKILRKIAVIVCIVGFVVLATRSYSSFLKNKARATNDCYYAGTIYKQGEYYNKGCQKCKCPANIQGKIDLSTACYDVVCPRTTMGIVNNIFFVK